MTLDILSNDERHKIRSHANRLFLDHCDLGLYVRSRLLAIANDGQHFAFVDDDTSTLFVCRMSTPTLFVEIGRLVAFEAESYAELEWDDSRLALLGVYHCQLHGRQRRRYETVWLPEEKLVACA